MFSLIISQLRGLSSVTANQAETQGMNHPVLYLLHNIATVSFFTSDANLVTDLDIKISTTSTVVDQSMIKT